MQSLLIKDTTRAQREEIVRRAQAGAVKRKRGAAGHARRSPYSYFYGTGR